MAQKAVTDFALGVLDNYLRILAGQGLAPSGEMLAVVVQVSGADVFVGTMSGYELEKP